MNSHSPQSPREELEARLTALLLDELPAEEAASLRQAMAQDTELAHLRDRLAQAIGLVRQAAASPNQQPLVSRDAPQLSPERRASLLKAFKVIRPKGLAKPGTFVRREWAAVAAMLVGLLIVGALLVAYYSSRSGQSGPVRENWMSGTTRAKQIADLYPAASEGRRAAASSAPADSPAAVGEALFADARGQDGATLTVQSPPPAAKPQTPPALSVTSAGRDQPITQPTSPAPHDTFALITAEPAFIPPPPPPSAAEAKQPDPRLEPRPKIFLPPAAGDAVSTTSIDENNDGRIALPPTTWTENSVTFNSRARGAGIDGSQALLGDLGKPAEYAGVSLANGGGIGSGTQPGGAPAPNYGISFMPAAAGIDGDAADKWPALYAAAPSDGIREKSFEQRVPGTNIVVSRFSMSVSSSTSNVAAWYAGGMGGAGQGAPVLQRAGGVIAPIAEPEWIGVLEAPKGTAPRTPEGGGVFSANAVGYGNGETGKPQLNGAALGAYRPSPDLRAGAKATENEAKKLAELSKSESLAQPTTPIALGIDANVKEVVSDLTRPDFERKSGLKSDEKAKANQPPAGNAAVDSQPIDRLATEPAKETSDPVATLNHELDQLRSTREKLAARAVQETVDSSIPKSSIVEVVDAAVETSPEKPSFWGRIRGFVNNDVERTSRISAETELSDISGLASFDSYRVQTEREKIQSKAVLEKVIDQLNLNQAWAKSHGGGNTLSTEETLRLLQKKIDVRAVPNTSLIEIRVRSDQPSEAARIANTIAQVYRDSRLAQRKEMNRRGIEILAATVVEQDKKIARVEEELGRRKKELNLAQVDEPPPKLAASAPIPQPEISTAENAFSTFSLNVSDVSFQLAAASLEKGQMPDPATVRSEEFINAFDYRDPEPAGSAPIAFAWERARYPFVHDRDLLRFSIKTAARGRQPGRPLNLVLLLDNSGSMERADRVRIRQECLRVLASQLQPQDRVSVVAFARTARLWVDGLPGSQSRELVQRAGGLTPEGGTNLEDAMNLAYQTALRHFLATGVNRVVLLTDGAANLGDVQPESLKKIVEAKRKQGIALDCFGIGWEGLNDELLEVLSRHGDGRYGFVNTPEAAPSEFASQLAGALQVAASDVKVQVEWNPRRVTAYRQMGYAKHQLTKEQFRDNSVDAAEIGAAEAGNALYTVQVNPRGEGPLGVVRVRFKIPGTSDYREHEWTVPYEGAAKPLEQSSPGLRLAASACAFSEWLVSSPFAAEVTLDKLLVCLSGVPEVFPADPRPKKLEWMIRQAKSVAGK